MTKPIVKPFVKWAGGKGQLLKEIQCRYPHKNSKAINKYCEPFVGGGAVLFDIIAQHNFDSVYIGDTNKELINTYCVIRDDIQSLLILLLELQNKFLPLSTDERKVMYYKCREEFNALKSCSNNELSPEKAALFIFLNKTCFNGLFRVNSKGLFNVPMGAYKNPLICDIENLTNASAVLQGVTIHFGDYKDSFSFIDKNTFVYIDPPYRPLTATASFTAYNETPFGDKEQIELAEYVAKLSRAGAKVVLSNSDPKNADAKDEFFDTLYSDYLIQRIFARRMINSNSEKRGNVSELLIVNY